MEGFNNSVWFFDNNNNRNGNRNYHVRDAFSKETMKYQVVIKYSYKNLLNIVLIPITEIKILI